MDNRIHAVLVGDSVLNNSAYVPPGCSVREQLAPRLAPNGRVTMLAAEGATAESIIRQLDQTPEDATHLFLSFGRNDAVAATRLFKNQRLPIRWNRESTSSIGGGLGDFLDTLGIVQAEFRRRFQILLDVAKASRVPTWVCTVYDNMPLPSDHHAEILSLFNDVIVAQATRYGASILDLRPHLTEEDDYSSLSPIEPSEQGGRKIAQAIVRAIPVESIGRRPAFAR